MSVTRFNYIVCYALQAFRMTNSLCLISDIESTLLIELNRIWLFGARQGNAKVTPFDFK